MPSDNVVRNAVFEIQVYESPDHRRPHAYGTGFLINDEYHIVTAAHVVNLDNPEQVIKVIVNGVEYLANIKQILNGEFDVALLLLEKPLSNTPLQFVQSYEEVEKSKTEIRVYGFPDQFDQNWFGGTIAGQSQDVRYQVRLDDPFEDQLTGLSGAPVLDDENNVLGVFVRHRPDDHFAEFTSSLTFVPRLNFIDDSSDTINCLVITSANEQTLEELGINTNLKTAVSAAIELLRNSELINKPIVVDYHNASDTFDTESEFREILIKLCRARIVIFDLTNYEPTSMYLLGVRSVVKRGITICSLGGDFKIGSATEFPFNIKEVNFSSHSEHQFLEKEFELQPHYLLYIRMLEGLTHYSSATYEDLPVYNGVRNLPNQKSRMIAIDEQILILCSYSQRYQDHNWSYVYHGFALQSAGQARFQPKLKRVLDLQSPNMISSTIYEHIRRTALCVVDFTGWRANVFFEFGVRSAIERNPNGTICVIDKADIEAMEKIADNPGSTDAIIDEYELISPTDSRRSFVSKRLKIIATQCLKILELFDYKEYVCELAQSQPYRQIIGAYSGDVMSVGQNGLIPTDVYHTISSHYDSEGETFALPVYEELKDAADLLEAKDTPTVLYPSNKQLVDLASQAVTEKYYAAWAYLDMRFGTEKINRDENLAREYVSIGYRLILRLSNPIEQQAIMQKLILFDQQVSSMVEEELTEATQHPNDMTFHNLTQFVEIYKFGGRVHRNNEAYDTALESLRKAIDILERLEPLKEVITYYDNERVIELFAECYGQLGSIYNRLQQYSEAAQQYRKGIDFEKNETYNLSNTIVNTILAEPQEIENLQDELKQLISRLRVQLDGERNNDFWAWLDYGQFQLLANDMTGALKAYQKVIDLGPEKWVYQTHMRVLNQLSAVLRDTDLDIYNAIEHIKNTILSDKMG